MSPKARMRVQLSLVVVWSLLTLGTTGFAVMYPEHPLLIPWLIFISCYAIVATHWAGFEGAAPSAKEDSEIPAVIQRLSPRAIEQIVTAVAQGRARG